MQALTRFPLIIFILLSTILTFLVQLRVYAQNPCTLEVDANLLTTEPQEMLLETQNLSITTRQTFIYDEFINRGFLKPGSVDLWAFSGLEGTGISILVLAYLENLNLLTLDAETEGISDSINFNHYIIFISPNGEIIIPAYGGGGMSRVGYVWNDFILPETGNYILLTGWIPEDIVYPDFAEVDYEVSINFGSSFGDETYFPPEDIFLAECEGASSWQTHEISPDSDIQFIADDWVEQDSEVTSLGSYMYTNDGNSEISLAFMGERLLIQYLAFSNFGIFEIYLDGELLGQIDSYSPESDILTTPIYEFAPGNHQLLIKNTDTKNPASSDVVMAIDTIEVFNPPEDTTQTPTQNLPVQTLNLLENEIVTLQLVFPQIEMSEGTPELWVECTYDADIVKIQSIQLDNETVLPSDESENFLSFPISPEQDSDENLAFELEIQAQKTGETKIDCILNVLDPVWQSLFEFTPTTQVILQPEPSTFFVVAGYVQLDGRTQHADVLIQLLQSEQTLAETIPNEDGFFEIEIQEEISGDFQLQATFPNYLPLGQTFRFLPESAYELLGTLLAGDLTNDGEIDVQDVAEMGLNFGSEAQADLTGDGQVDLNDLVLLSLSYGKEGEQPWEIIAD